MKKNVDKSAYIQDLEANNKYAHPLEAGNYLGFYIPGDTVILKRIEELLNGKRPQLVSVPVAKLFR
jgi:hypothetical protein